MYRRNTGFGFSPHPSTFSCYQQLANNKQKQQGLECSKKSKVLDVYLDTLNDPDSFSGDSDSPKTVASEQVLGSLEREVAFESEDLGHLDLLPEETRLYIEGAVKSRSHPLRRVQKVYDRLNEGSQQIDLQNARLKEKCISRDPRAEGFGQKLKPRVHFALDENTRSGVEEEVVLVPTRNEAAYEFAKDKCRDNLWSVLGYEKELVDSLHWTPEEGDAIKLSARKEVQRYMYDSNCDDPGVALAVLYQPNPKKAIEALYKQREEQKLQLK